MAHMFQDLLLNQTQKVITMKHALQEWLKHISCFMILIHELLNKDPDTVPEEAPLIILDSKYGVCVANNGKDTKNTSHIARIVHLIRNGELQNAQY